jgi:hypothetical protein
MDTTTSTPSALSDDELLRLWTEAGGDSGYGHTYIEASKFLRFLRSFAARIRAEERDELIAALREASLQIEYLQQKFAPTGSGAAVLARTHALLAKADSTRTKRGEAAAASRAESIRSDQPA